MVEHVLKGLLEAQAFISFAGQSEYRAANHDAANENHRSDRFKEGYQDFLVGFERKPYPSAEGLRIFSA